MKRVTLTILILLSILPLAYAAPTKIDIKTLPNHTVFVSIIRPSSISDYIEVLKTTSDSRGKATTTFTNEEYQIFDVAVKVKKGTATIFFEKFGTKNAEDHLEFELLPEGYVDPLENLCSEEKLENCHDERTCLGINGHWYGDSCHSESEPDPEPEPEPEVVEEIKEEKIPESENTITGFSIFGEDGAKGFFTNKAFLIVIGILVVLIVGAIFAKNKLATTSKGKIDHPHNAHVLEHQLTSAERKLKAAQAEINKLRNKDRIDAARRKVEEDKDHLHKLERGEI